MTMTPAETIDVMEDLAAFIDACKELVKRDETLFLRPPMSDKQKQAKDLSDSGFFDYAKVAKLSTPMQLVKHLKDAWRGITPSAMAFRAEAIANKLSCFMQEFGEPELPAHAKEAAGLLRDMADKIEEGVIGINELTMERTDDLPSRALGGMNLKMSPERTMTITYRVK